MTNNTDKALAAIDNLILQNDKSYKQECDLCDEYFLDKENAYKYWRDTKAALTFTRTILEQHKPDENGLEPKSAKLAYTIWEIRQELKCKNINGTIWNDALRYLEESQKPSRTTTTAIEKLLQSVVE